MQKALCFLCCDDVRPEIEAAVAAEGWTDVNVLALGPDRAALDWHGMRRQVTDDCGLIAVLGLADFPEPPEGWPPIRRVPLPNRFQLLAGKTLVDDLLARDAFLITPAWLENWREHVGDLQPVRTRQRQLVLLDTGILPDAACRFAELAQATGLSTLHIATGLDHVRLLLSRVLAEIRLEEEVKKCAELERDHLRERADHLAAMDFLGRLALLKDEQEAIAAIAEMFHMLFAPLELHYVRFENGVAQHGESLPADLARQFQALATDWAWTESGTGFLLRIGRAGETLGAVAVDNFVFPQFRNHYLNLALSVAGVCALAIENARTYLQIKETEQALRMSEQRLKMAQAIAHLGHWEWDFGSGDIKWSEETYRILGYDPHAITPSHDTFFRVIHPDDRTSVAEKIAQAGAEGGFDVEYRIVRPDGQLRMVHGMGEVIFLGASHYPKLVGALQDVAESARVEVLGVIQDITERKELEWRLEQEARTDPLTGCANRRYFRELSEHEFARARRYGSELSVLMLDIDHFKLVNDLHGHQAGDAALQKLVQACRAILRETDVIGRLGGEEFAIVLAETGSARAFEVAERLRLSVAAAEVSVDCKPPLRVTVSIGITSLEPKDSSFDAVTRRADQALYEAKETGRNKVAARRSSSISTQEDEPQLLSPFDSLGSR